MKAATIAPLQLLCFSLAVLFGQTLLTDTAQAYSYAAKGREPVMEGWLAISASLDKGNNQAAALALDDLSDELTWMESERDAPLVWPLEQAVRENDATLAGKTFIDAFRTLIDLRLEAAQEQLSDYQAAKVLVVKSGLFLDTLLNDPGLLGLHADEEHRTQARSALEQCLTSLGNPGVFGAGATPADPVAFDQARHQLLSILQSF